VNDSSSGNGMSRWEQRLRELEANYRKLYGDEALCGYDLEAEVSA